MTPGIEDVRKFYDERVERLSKENNRHRSVYVFLDSYIPPIPCSVLDIGCGTGQTSRHLASRGRNVVAIDLSPVLIDYARSHSNGARIEYITADITTWTPGRRFDYIVMADSLEHILPGSVDSLMSVLDSASHDKTITLLSVPHPEWMRVAASRGILPQIVDIPWSMGDVESRFRQAGYMPLVFDARPGGYYHAVLVRKEAFYATYNTGG
jgi:SAM-dependent methyltransferase